MQDDYKIEVANDIWMAIRIQGQAFECAQLYEPVASSGDMIITEHRMRLDLQIRGAKILGLLMSNCLWEVVDSELGRRLQRDKWLTQVMSAFHYGLGHQREQRYKELQRVQQSLTITSGM
jgi:hypothetical protein